MRNTLSAIVAVSLLGAGCASSLQDTRMYKGPFGRTEVGAVMIAADPAASKVLVETYDGDLWIYEVDSTALGRLSSLRVGDEVVLAFDDRIAGKRAIDVSVIAPGRRALPPGMLSIAAMLPMGVQFGAPAVFGGSSGAAMADGAAWPADTGMVAGGGFVAGTAGSAFINPNGTVVANGPGVVNGLATGNGVPVISGPGVIVPGFGSFSALPGGLVQPQTAVGLGLGPGVFTSAPLAPMGGPSVANTGGGPGRAPFSQGNFTPGTTSPGVTTANPNAPGSAVVQGPFTPGTIAPGVSQQRGNAPPAAAGATTGGTAGPRQTMTRGTPAVTAAPVVNGTSMPVNGNGTPIGTGTTAPTTTTGAPGAIPGSTTTPGTSAGTSTGTGTGTPTQTGPRPAGVGTQGQPAAPQGQAGGARGGSVGGAPSGGGPNR